MKGYSTSSNWVLRFCILAITCVLHMVFATAKTTTVKTQEQFDAVVDRINSGEELELHLSNKTFLLKKKINATNPLCIIGNNATILGFFEKIKTSNSTRNENGFNIYSISKEITPFALFFDAKGNIVNVSESVDAFLRVNHAEGGIVAGTDMNSGTIVKIPIPEHLKHLRNKDFYKAFGYFDCGWQTVNFILERADNSFFYCKTLNLCRTGNFSYDKQKNKEYVRFVIYNAEKKQGAIYYDDEYLYVPNSLNELNYLDCRSYIGTKSDIVIHSEFSMKGVHFKGISISINTEAKKRCDITGCTFSNTLGCALSVTRFGDYPQITAKINGCTFEHVSLLTDYAISMNSPNVEGCYISMTGCEVVRYVDEMVGYKNPNGCVGVKGNVVLENNIIWNTPRCHLYFNSGNIVAKGNILYNTDQFNSYAERNLSSDFGLVYCNHVYKSADKAIANHLNKILLEQNLLYGAYAYRGDARGVFIDNGRGDVTCKGNIILSCQLYSMDSRNSFQDAASIRNKFEGNIVTTIYRLIAGSVVIGDNTPITRSNILLAKPHNKVSNVNVQAEDIFIEDIDQTSSCEGQKIIVSQSLYNVIKKSPAWKSVKKYVMKSN